MTDHITRIAATPEVEEALAEHRDEYFPTKDTIHALIRAVIAALPLTPEIVECVSDKATGVRDEGPMKGVAFMRSKLFVTAYKAALLGEVK